MAALPGRTASGIYQQACKAGLNGSRGPAGRSRHSWTTTAHVDDAIRRVYQRDPSKGDVNALATTLQRPRWWVSKRARDLGLVSPRFRPLAWTPEEDETLRENPSKALSTIKRLLKRRGFDRTETSIKVRMKRVGVSRADDPDHFTATGLAGVFGVDAKTVSGWIDRGLLTAKRRGTARTESQGGDQWWIKRADVKRFVVENVAAIDLRKVDKFWFVDLLAAAA